MASVGGFPTDALAQPIEYIEGTSGDFGAEPMPGFWQPIAGRPAVPVVTEDMSSEEQVRAGIDKPTVAKRLYFNLTGGEPPLTTSDTVDIGGNRFNVRSVVVYDKAGFPKAGIAEVVKL
jgi:hypothetical protein